MRKSLSNWGGRKQVDFFVYYRFEVIRLVCLYCRVLYGDATNNEWVPDFVTRFIWTFRLAEIQLFSTQSYTN
jgi:hypothetical protein